MSDAGPHISNVAPWPGPPFSGLLRPCRRPLILTGAGVSAGCGLPTGAGLAGWLRSQAFAAGVDFSHLDVLGHGAHPGYVASTILDHDNKLIDKMDVAVAEHILACQATASVSRVVAAIAATPVGVVVTLNYDTLLESAAQAGGRTAHTLKLRDVPSLINDHLYEPDGALRVVHLHGVADDPGSLVLDHESYMRQANEDQVRELFAALMAYHNLCAIGTQFEEDYLAAVMLARRPTRPRHVLMCDVDLAQRVVDDHAGIGVYRHRWLPCAYPVGDYAALDGFCEQLVTCDEESAASAGPVISVAALAGDASYAARRLVARDEIDDDTELSIELQLQFGRLGAHSETVLEQEQLAIVVGPPGSGKSRLVQELASRDRRVGERAVLIRLRDVRHFIGEPKLLLRRWLDHGVVVGGEHVAIDDVLAGSVGVWVLLDGLDEIPLGHRTVAAEAVQRLAAAYPQHRFLVTTRPVPSLANLSPIWRVFDLLCDGEWQREFLRVNAIPEQEVWDALGAATVRLRSLLNIPFFLRGAVRLIMDGTAVADAMQIALALLDQALAADEHLSTLGGAPRRWLSTVALHQQLSGSSATDFEVLAALAAREDGLGDPTEVADLLAGRSLLAASSDGSWAFEHRLFGEALAAEQLLSDDPERWLDAVAPVVDGWSAVLAHWGASVQMVASRSFAWREAVSRRDPRFAARATPPEAPVSERRRAARNLWRRATELDVWIDPMRSDFETVTDGEIVADLMRPGDLEALEREIREAIHGPTRFVRGNAVDVLAMIPVDDIAALLAEVLTGDDDAVVRRSAASAARRLELTDLVELVIERAMAPADESEAGDMASVALRLSTPERRLEVATALAEAGNREVRDYLVLEGVPLDDRLSWLAMRARQERGSSYTLQREFADLVAELGGLDDEELAEKLGYVAAVLESDDEDVAEVIGRAPATARGIVAALAEGGVFKWQIARLLKAVGVDALRDAGASQDVLELVTEWQAARDAPPAVRERRPARNGANAESHDLSAVLQMPTDERRRELIRWSRLDRATATGLAESEKGVLRQTLDEWWSDNDLREAVDVTGRSATIAHWAMVILTFGPALHFELSDERWIQVATCGWLFEPQYKWLIEQVTQGRLDRAAAEASENFHVLTELLYIGTQLDAEGVVAQLLKVEDVPANASDRGRVGDFLLKAGNRAGLIALAESSEQWRETLRMQLAAVGLVEAQLTELALLAERLRRGERPDGFEVAWLSGVEDPATLAALEEVLIAAGHLPAPEAYPDITVPVLNAITRLGVSTAVEVLDRISRERPYAGAQFLIDERDRLIQFLIEPAGRAAGRRRAEAIGLPAANSHE